MKLKNVLKVGDIVDCLHPDGHVHRMNIQVENIALLSGWKGRETKMWMIEWCRLGAKYACWWPVSQCRKVQQ